MRIEYSNNYCLKIKDNHTKDSIYESIPKTDNVKEFLEINTQSSPRIKRMSF